MDMDTELQQQILGYLKEHPAPQSAKVWNEFAKAVGDEEKLVAHMLYLEEHGLIKSGITRGTNGHNMINSGIMRLTARGRDYISADGGLSAALNTVTVKLHEESLARIAEFVARRAPDQTVSAKMLDRLRELPAAAIERFSGKIMDVAMEKCPAEVFRLIQKAIGLE
jgi:hypothetical protein